MRPYLLTGILFLASCGGDSSRQQPADQPGVPTITAGTPAPSAASGVVHEVKMELTNGKYVFDPARLTIRPGDTVRWINVSGGPHNVQFKSGRIPDGATEVLNAAMSDRLGAVMGPFLTKPNQTYEISFANAPVGDYVYTCTPHEALGMNATLTVQP